MFSLRPHSRIYFTLPFCLSYDMAIAKIYLSLYFSVPEYPGGGTLLADGRGSAVRVSESYPLLISESSHHTHFYDEFWRKLPIFDYFFFYFWNTHQCLKTSAEKWNLFRELLAQKPTQMGITYSNPQHVMYPPPQLKI